MAKESKTDKEVWEEFSNWISSRPTIFGGSHNEVRNGEQKYNYIIIEGLGLQIHSDFTITMPRESIDREPAKSELVTQIKEHTIQGILAAVIEVLLQERRLCVENGKQFDIIKELLIKIYRLERFRL